jgi:hypothetical protein
MTTKLARFVLAERYPEAKALVEREERARRKAKALPRPKIAGPTPLSRRADHIAATAKLRVAIFVEYDGHCAACRSDLGNAWEFHHIMSGGDRRPKQRIGNVLPLCWDCHRRAHRGELGTLAQIALAPSLDAEARRAAEHRITKIEEARRTPSVPVRIEEKARG